MIGQSTTGLRPIVNFVVSRDEDQMNLIVEKTPRIKWYSDLRPFFSEIEALVQSYVWLWTDIETDVPVPFEYDPMRMNWISGPTLFGFVSQGPQFVWSVLSAIPAEKEQHARSLNCQPYADMNREFWIGTPKPQHPDADFEIVCWDASATLVIGANEFVADAFRDAYPDASDLDIANSRRA
jgi:hypothetical protein